MTPSAALLSSSFPPGGAADLFFALDGHTCTPGAICLDATRRETPDAIERLLRERERITDRAAEDVGAMLSDLAVRLADEMRPLFDGQPDAVRLRVLGLTLDDTLGILDSLRDAQGHPILTAGLQEWVDALDDLAALATETTEVGLNVAGLDTEGLAVANGGALGNAQAKWDTKVRRILGDAVLQAANNALYLKPDAVTARIREMVEDLTPALVTEARTAAAVYDRTVAAATAQAADPTGDALRYVYVGPVDGLQRPFCRAVTGKAWTIEQVGRLRNGQAGQPAMEFGGGYNCRHQFVAMSRATAHRRGYGDASEVDLVAANLAPLKRGRR